MARIVHLSDLHFGAIDEPLIEPLVQTVQELEPRLVVVSGDLTQRATDEQFAAAAAFLARLPGPQIVVPGNHDIPLWNVARRFVTPLGAYRRHIGKTIETAYQDDDLLVIGLNSARSLTWKEGRISHDQIARLEARLAVAGPQTLKIIVAHHPFVAPHEESNLQVVGRAERALLELERCGADLILAGHLHRGFTRTTQARDPETQRSILVIQAGTALSHRRRHEPNSFHVLEVEPDAITLFPFAWSEVSVAFVQQPELRFVGRARWQPAADAESMLEVPQPTVAMASVVEMKPATTSERIDIIVNPKSGFAPRSREDEICRAFARHPHVQCHVHTLDENCDLVCIVENAIAAGTATIVAAGGDGTISAVAGLLAGKSAALGILPAGSLNHFAKDLRIPLDLDAAVDVICTGRTAQVDVGEINGRRFLNNVSLGAYPRMVRLRDRWRRYIGKWPAMFAAMVVVLARLPALRVHVEWPGHRSRRFVPFLFLGNNVYKMDWPAFGQRSSIDDGVLDVVMVKQIGLWRLLRVMWLALTGRLNACEDIESAQVTELTIRSRRPRLHVGIDGETCKLATPLVCRIEPRALRVRVPGTE